MFGNFLAVYRFELKQAMSFARLLWWGGLTLFPIAIVTLIAIIPGAPPEQAWLSFLFALIPMLVSMLGTFMWTTSAVSAEVERQSWVYLAVKPGGRTAVVLGKYLAAVSWVLPAALVSLTACLAIVFVFDGDAIEGEAFNAARAMKLWLVFAQLACLSVPAYAGLYLALGALFVKRSMVMAVAYTLIFELLVGWIPAIVNKLTIQHRLTMLFMQWTDLDLAGASQFFDQLTGNTSSSAHAVILIVYAILMVVLAVYIVRQREYVGSTVAEG